MFGNFKNSNTQYVIHNMIFTWLLMYLRVFYIILVSHLKASKIECVINKINVRFKAETSREA